MTQLHTDSAVSIQHLAWRAVTAKLAAPKAVLGNKEGRAQVFGKRGAQGDCSGLRGMPRKHDEVKKVAPGGRGRLREVQCSSS